VIPVVHYSARRSAGLLLLDAKALCARPVRRVERGVRGRGCGGQTAGATGSPASMAARLSCSSHVISVVSVPSRSALARCTPS